jgi:hypothetical protein
MAADVPGVGPVVVSLAGLRWTSKSTRKLAEELRQQGFQVSPQKVGQLLHASGDSLQATHRREARGAPATQSRRLP